MPSAALLLDLRKASARQTAERQGIVIWIGRNWTSLRHGVPLDGFSMSCTRRNGARSTSS